MCNRFNAAAGISAAECLDDDACIRFRIAYHDTFRFQFQMGSVTWWAKLLVRGFGLRDPWRYYRLSNGGAYVALEDGEYTVSRPDAPGRQAFVMSGDAAGIVISMKALAVSEGPGERSRLLLAYAAQHREAEAIDGMLARHTAASTASCVSLLQPMSDRALSHGARRISNAR